MQSLLTQSAFTKSFQSQNPEALAHAVSAGDHQAVWATFKGCYKGDTKAPRVSTRVTIQVTTKAAARVP